MRFLRVPVAVAQLAAGVAFGVAVAPSDADAATCSPTPPAGVWSGTWTSTHAASIAGTWIATLSVTAPVAGTSHVSGTTTITGPTGVVNDSLTGTVKCGVYTVGTSHGIDYQGTFAPNGRSVSGTYTNPPLSDFGIWDGSFVPPPSVSVAPDTNLLDGQNVTVAGSGFTPLAQIRTFECPPNVKIRSQCDILRGAFTSADSAGAFTFTRPISRILFPTTTALDCVKVSCTLRAENTGLTAQVANAALSFTKVTASCTVTQTCDATLSIHGLSTAPGLTVEVSGKPTPGSGTVQLDIGPGRLHCPGVADTVVPVADLVDTGFPPTTDLNVTATNTLATATGPLDVCFSSTVAFKSKSSPTVAKAGTALLLDCPKVANVSPCVRSRTNNVVVRFVVPGGDPRFCLVLPTGRQAWLSSSGTGKVGTPYAVRLQASGGRAPMRWKVTSGKLPNGLTLNVKTGAITGKPTARGRFTFVAQATDSENPPKTAKLTLPIVIK